MTCRHRTIPAGVRKPHEGGDGQPRRVRSQAERDDDALALAERVGILLGAIAATLADERLHVTSRARLEWYAAEIRDAGKAGRAARVAELEDRLAGERIRYKHWWNGTGPAVTADVYDVDVVDDDQADELRADEPRLAIAAGPAPTVDFRAELAARGWTLRPPGDLRCHIVREDGTDCAGLAQHAIPGGMVCDRQYRALLTPKAGRL